jgi:hypothetical protein
MMTNAKVGVALVGGYVLGRTKKAKLAIGLGMFLAGKKLDLDPRALKRLLTESPVVGALSDQVRDELIGATKAAATRALTQRVTGLADSLHERTRVLGGTADDGEDDGGGRSGRRAEDDAYDVDDVDDAREGAEDEADRGDAPEESAPRRKRVPAKKPAARSTASDGRSTARKAPARTSTARSGGSSRGTASRPRRAKGGDNA